MAGTAIGAINAAIIAGNLPHERVYRLRQFWQELGRRAVRRGGPRIGRRLRGWLAARQPGHGEGDLGVAGAVATPPGELRELVLSAVDFDRVNSGGVRLVLGAVNLATGAE